MTEHTSPLEIDGGRPIWILTFSADGKYLVSGDDKAVRVWRTGSGEETGTMTAHNVRSLAVSNDGKWVAAGTELGRFTVWDAHTCKRMFSHKENGSAIRAVDFSPDSSRLVTGSSNSTTSIWEVRPSTCARVLGPLHHQQGVIAAKYSPRGDQIATCTDSGSVRIHDGYTGHLVIDIPITVTVHCNHGLVWSNDGRHLFVLSDGKIKQIQISTGTLLDAWPIHSSPNHAWIALSKSGDFIAYSSNRTVKILELRTCSYFYQTIKYHQDVHSAALSLDDRFLATSTKDGKIAVRNLQDVMMPSCFSGPFVHAGTAVLDAWEKGQLSETEALLTEDITLSGHMNYRALANRALIRTQLQQWDTARSDAEMSIEVQPSVIGFVAKSVALVGEGKVREGYRMCDLAFKHCDSDHVDTLLAIKGVIVWMAGEHADALSRMADLISANEESIHQTIQAYMHLLLGISRLKDQEYEGAIQSLEHVRIPTQHRTSRRLRMISLMFGWHFDDLNLTVQRNLCEALCAAGRMNDAEDTFMKILNSRTEKNDAMEFTEWISRFTLRCLSTLQCDQVSSSAVYPRPLLTEWARTTLTRISWKDALVAAGGFTVPRIMTYRVIIEHLEMADLLMDAVGCFHQMVDELALARDEKVEWIIDFKCRSARELEDTGDATIDARRYDEAILRYSASLDLCPTGPQARLAKRSKVYIAKGLWREALRDADEIIALDSSFVTGYERRHAALWGERRYEEAEVVFQTMLSKMSESPDPGIRARSHQYVKPEATKAVVRKTVQDITRDLPRVLMNTASGCLFNKLEQASAFESVPLFTELVTSMTTRVDYTRIQREVAQFYRYVTLSHTWDKEELFDRVTHIDLSSLEESYARDKLQTFCKVAQEAGFHWAWSDICCVNRQDHAVLQEALVAMFKWYEGSAAMIVFLRGVHSPSKRGDLQKSIWNTRAWTLQEYHAAPVVWFYTEDWTPYLNLNIPNHKEAPEIISEMEEATGISRLDLMALRPGPDDIWQKLFLVSQRQTTFVEDAAYSLLGLFSMPLPIKYGEGDSALGRLLAHLLASSGDTSILAWAGQSGSFNSCFPANIAVFGQFPASHIPLPIKDSEMDMIATKLRTSPLCISAAAKLYDRINDLPIPTVLGKVITVPCIVFRLEFHKSTSNRAFHAKSTALGTVEIRTMEDLSQLEFVFAVHPWIDFLLNRQPGRGLDTLSEVTPLGGSFPKDVLSLSGLSGSILIRGRTQTARIVARFRQSLGGRLAKPIPDASSLSQSLSPSRIPMVDRQREVLYFIARLRQPFAPLLFAPIRFGGGSAFRRVATDSVSTVQIRENTSLSDLAANVQVLDVI